VGISGGQALDDRRFRLFEIGEFQNRFRIAFAFLLGHSSSLHDLERADIPKYAGAFLVTYLEFRLLLSKKRPMSKVRVAAFSISLDGFGAGPRGLFRSCREGPLVL
jgi:hypothetical protein